MIWHRTTHSKGSAGLACISLPYGNYCDYYKMELNGNGYEPTCRNEEQKTNNDKIQTKWKITSKK